jgi:hypothetical protein
MHYVRRGGHFCWAIQHDPKVRPVSVPPSGIMCPSVAPTLLSSHMPAFLHYIPILDMLLLKQQWLTDPSDSQLFYTRDFCMRATCSPDSNSSVGGSSMSKPACLCIKAVQSLSHIRVLHAIES